LTPERDYFVAPPTEIGEVLSADVSLRKGTRVRGLGACLLAALVLGIVGFLLGWLLMAFLEPKDATASPTVGVLLALFGALAGWGLTRFKHVCRYVGREGVARFVCAARRQRLTLCEVFLFRDAADLRTSQTQVHRNGFYQGTEFRFDWTDAAGRVRFQITGAYRGSGDGRNPWTDGHYQWGCAAETAWNLYRLAHRADESEPHGPARFALAGDDWLAVGQGFLDVHRGGETTRCTAQEIEEFSLSEGVFTLRLRGGREGLFGSRGVYKFGYGEVANVQQFLLALEQRLGIAFRA
jgi:hypothetical protein